MIDLTVDSDPDGLLCVKLQSDDWEINVIATQAEFLALGQIESADWDTRRSIRAGATAGASVFWSSKD